MVEGKLKQAWSRSSSKYLFCIMNYTEICVANLTFEFKIKYHCILTAQPILCFSCFYVCSF